MPAKLFVPVQLTTKTELTQNDLLVLDRAEAGTSIKSRVEVWRGGIVG